MKKEKNEKKNVDFPISITTEVKRMINYICIA